MSKIIIKNMDYEIYTKKADPIDKEVFNGNHFEENFNKNLAYAKIAVDGRNHGLGFYVCKYKPRNRVMLQTLAVSKKHQRKSIGKILIKNAIKEAKKRKFVGIYLYVRIKNKFAFDWYKRLGFSVYRKDRWCYSMRKKLKV